MTRKSTIPWHLIALDGVGALLVAWGFYRYTSAEQGLGFIIAGFLLMTPLVVYIINAASTRAANNKAENKEP